MCHKELEEMSFDELVDFYWGRLIIGIGEGEGKSALWLAINQALLWKEAKDKKKNSQVM